MLAVLAAVVVGGGLLTVTQVSNASTYPWAKRRPQLPACAPTNAGGATQGGSASASASANSGPLVTTQNGRKVRQWRDENNPGQEIRRGNRGPRPTCTPTRPANGSASPSTSTSTPPPLDIQATNCDDDSNLPDHNGFQEGNRCVGVDHGEVSELAKNPTAIVAEFPEDGVAVNTPFTVTVSSQNIIRNRFLPAAQGGYYAEMDKLNAQGFATGHLHFACRIVNNVNEAPDPVRSDFFVALEDNGGSDNPDQIVVNVPGLPRTGTALCMVWAGGGSHRVPLTQFANTAPAVDVVRFEVR